LDQSNICRDIQKIEKLIRQCIPIPQKIYNITKRLKTLEEVERYFPAGFLAFIDSTEQQIPRPVNKRKRKAYYSGKNRRHTVKTQMMVNDHGYILHKKGRRHDYDTYKKNHPLTPKDVVNVFDLEYLGVEKDFPEQLSPIPNRKKRNQGGSSQQKKLTKIILKKEL